MRPWPSTHYLNPHLVAFHGLHHDHGGAHRLVFAKLGNRNPIDRAIAHPGILERAPAHTALNASTAIPESAQVDLACPSGAA